MLYIGRNLERKVFDKERNFIGIPIKDVGKDRDIEIMVATYIPGGNILLDLKGTITPGISLIAIRERDKVCITASYILPGESRTFDENVTTEDILERSKIDIKNPENAYHLALTELGLQEIFQKGILPETYSSLFTEEEKEKIVKMVEELRKGKILSEKIIKLSKLYYLFPTVIYPTIVLVGNIYSKSHEVAKDILKGIFKGVKSINVYPTLVTEIPERIPEELDNIEEWLKGIDRFLLNREIRIGKKYQGIPIRYFMDDFFHIISKTDNLPKDEEVLIRINKNLERILESHRKKGEFEIPSAMDILQDYKGKILENISDIIALPKDSRWIGRNVGEIKRICPVISFGNQKEFANSGDLGSVYIDESFFRRVYEYILTDYQGKILGNSLTIHYIIGPYRVGKTTYVLLQGLAALCYILGRDGFKKLLDILESQGKRKVDIFDVGGKPQEDIEIFSEEEFDLEGLYAELVME